MIKLLLQRYGPIDRKTGRSTSRPLISVKALLDSAILALPDTADFGHSHYTPTLHVDYFAQPQVGYVRDNFGSGVYGGAAVALSDIMANRRLLVGGQVNGHLAESQFLAMYANMAHRANWAVGLEQTPFFYFTGADITSDETGRRILNQRLQRFVVRRAFMEVHRPFSRFSRLEARVSGVNVDVGELTFQTTYDPTGGIILDQDITRSTYGVETYVQPTIAWVFDNTIPYYMGPVRGRRSRVEYAPAFGSWRFDQLLVDSRRYDHVAGPLVLATRLLFFGRMGRESNSFPIFLGVPDLLRGYTSGSFRRHECSTELSDRTACHDLNQLIGSRIAVVNAELRFPLLRGQFAERILPAAEGAVFFDSGIAWNGGDRLTLTRTEDDDKQTVREPLSSWGVSIRGVVAGFLVLKADLTKPLSRAGHTPYWTLSIGPTF